MSGGSIDLHNGLRINAEQPRKHAKPEYCKDCRTFYYYGGHFCTEKNEPSKAFKRAIQGYYDGE